MYYAELLHFLKSGVFGSPNLFIVVTEFGQFWSKKLYITIQNIQIDEVFRHTLVFDGEFHV